jgi:ATP-dependent RNA helicase RhlB
LLKKITSKLKTLFGGKKKTTAVPVVTAAKETQSAAVRHNKPYPQQKSGGSRPLREPRKKETREEYRLRHEKRAQSSTAEGAKPAPQTKTIKPVLAVPSEPWDENIFKVPVAEGKIRFHEFHLPKEIMHAIYDLGFKYCTPVQAEVLLKSLAGDDVTAQAQTGTGKTAAFLIIIYNHILKNPMDKKRKAGTPRALILAPTRELVLQIEKDARGLGKYVPCSILAILGGMDYAKQQKFLRGEPCDILMCTPGRLIDFMKKRLVDLSKVEMLIIDEADRMLDMGFIPDVKKIVLSTPSKTKRQTMFFSATLTGDVKRLADSWTRQAYEITIQPDDIAVQTVKQITYITTIEEKPTLLYNLIMMQKLERVLVFANRRDEAKHLKEVFETYGISCAFLSGDVEQSQRIKRLESFREGKVRVLVATDVASRGIHVEAISHVINYNMPLDPEEYVHRIGRTGRAGALGVSINFADEEDSYELGKLEEYLDKKIECTFPDPSLLIPIPEMYKKLAPPKPRHRPSNNTGSRTGRGPNRNSGSGRNSNSSRSSDKNPSQNSGRSQQGSSNRNRSYNTNRNTNSTANPAPAAASGESK